MAVLTTNGETYFNNAFNSVWPKIPGPTPRYNAYRKKSLDRNPNIDVRVKPYIVQGSLSSRREKMRHVMVAAPMTGKT